MTKLCQHRKLIVVEASGYYLPLIMQPHDFAHRHIQPPASGGQRPERPVVDAACTELGNYDVARIDV
jgi:hypothetical protein